MTLQKKNHHLTYEERIIIEDMLVRKQSLYVIAQKLGRSASTISREVRNRRKSYKSTGNDCANLRGCVQKQLCKWSNCTKLCHTCKRCIKYCPNYQKLQCPKNMSAPYVCNSCSKFYGCSMDRYRYEAKYAQNQYRELLVEHRTGFDVTLGDLEYINGLVSPLIKNGQSPYHIKQSLQEALPVSESTLRRMIDSCELDVKNIDLRDKVKRRKRSARPLHNEKDISILKIGHLYKDYLNYISDNDCSIVEMDCVEGKKEDNAVLLTLHLQNSHLHLAFIMNSQSSQNVIAVLDMLETTLGADLFQIIFGVCLTDNGKEFTDIPGMEKSVFGHQRRMSIFFCDPNRPDEKGKCENNHKYIRYIIPKGHSLEAYHQSDITLMMNHINSLKRKSLFGKSPYEVAMNVLPEDFFILLGLESIPPEQIILQPKLLRKSCIAD